MLYADMPNIGVRVPVVYESAFFADGHGGDDVTPSDEAIRNAVTVAKAQRQAPWFATADFTVVDVERWPIWPFAGMAQHRQAIGRYADIAKRFGALLAKPICLYGLLPEAGINHAARAARDAGTMQAWRAASTLSATALIEHVDALCPALYSYYEARSIRRPGSPFKQWQTFARMTINEGRRVAEGKPIYAFMWPQYHSGGSVKDYRFVSAEVWEQQLKTVRELADGIILWGGWNFANNTQLPWDDEAPWWQVTKRVFPELVTGDER